MRARSYFLGDGLYKRVARGSVLTVFSFGMQNLVRLAGNLVLTRLLFPEAFGIMALVQVVMAGLNMFSDIGLRPAIVQDPRGDDPVFLNTAWVIQIIRGFVLWIVVWLFAAPVASFYDTPILADLLPVAGLAVIFQGFGSTKLATANRSLTLGRMTALNISAQIVGLATIIGLTLLWKSVWALVIGGLVAPALISVLSHFVLPGAINRVEFEAAAARRLLGFGKYVFLATIAGFMVSQADRAILGKIMSLEVLALYSIAFFFASVPQQLMSRLVENVIFPLYSSAPPRESAENRRKIARTRMLMTGSCFSLLAFLALTGNYLVTLLYDPRYEMAGPILILIAISQSFPLITASYSDLLLAAGRSGHFAVLTFITAGLRIAALLAGAATFGIIGMIFAPLVATVVLYPVLLYFIRPYSGWDPKHDALVFVASLAIGISALWINPVALEAIMSGINP